MKTSDLPNLISILRIALVVPVVICLLEGLYGGALLLFLIAGASDGLDGFLARRFGWTSRLGAILDPIGDKLLMVAVFLVLGAKFYLPWWLVTVVILRDVVIITGAVSYHALIEQVDMQPLRISKLNTALQILLVLVVLYSLAALGPLPPPILTQSLIYMVLLTTLASGIAYVVGWSRRAQQAVKRRD
ncbi:MAG: CDP-alcohol phosphatidyltransferase family protein [Gammaproteobacteria bacterium]